MKRNTIVEFIHELGDGGASALVKDYSLLLKKDGFKVVVLVVFPEFNAVTFQTLLENGIEIRSVFKTKNIINRFKNKFFDKRYISHYLKKVISEFNPIAIHAHLAVLRYLAPITNDLKSINVLYTCHSLPNKNFEGNNTKEAFAAKTLIDNNDLQLIALHEDMAIELNNRFGITNTVVIKNGIDFKKFLNVAVTKSEVREKMHIPQDAYVIGHVGRLSKVKNHKFLIDVFARVKERNSSAFLLLVGIGELETEIRDYLKQKGVEDSSMLLSHRKDIPELMTAMDVFCLPSFYEGFSIATLEAQVIGLNCVVADTLPKQVFLTRKITALPLSSSVDVWAEALLIPKNNVQTYGNICEYDMNIEIKKLEKLYLKVKNE